MTNRILLSAVAAAALTIGSNVAFAGSSSTGHGGYDSNNTSGSSATMGSQSGTTGNQPGATRGTMGGTMGGSSATTGGMNGSSGSGAMLNSQQRQSLKSALSDQDVKSVDSSKVQARVGSKVPSSVDLHKLPSKATANVPAMKGDRFVKLDNGTILIVSGDSRTVVDVIQG